MDQTHVALSLFFVLFVIVLPWIIKKYNLKDDIKHKDTLPIGTAKFRAFIKFAGWILAAFVFLALAMSTFDLLGVEF